MGRCWTCQRVPRRRREARRRRRPRRRLRWQRAARSRRERHAERQHGRRRALRRRCRRRVAIRRLVLTRLGCLRRSDRFTNVGLDRVVATGRVDAILHRSCMNQQKELIQLSQYYTREHLRGIQYIDSPIYWYICSNSRAICWVWVTYAVLIQ